MAVFQIFQDRFFVGQSFNSQKGPMKSKTVIPQIPFFENVISGSSLGSGPFSLRAGQRRSNVGAGVGEGAGEGQEQGKEREKGRSRSRVGAE